MTTEQFIEKAINHLEQDRLEDYDVISAGVSPWEDAPKGSVIAITIKLRTREITYEVWEYGRLLEDMGEDEFVFARVGSTGPGDADDYENGRW